MTDTIPRTIWMLWLQGRAEATGLVKACIESWETMNPGWQVVVLDEETAKEYVDVDAILGPNQAVIRKAATSDILRINLLAEHGGVWADATCLCVRPLDEWLGEVVPSGFFAFERPGPDRMIASWFLASTPDCVLTQAYRDAVNAYWSENTFDSIVHRVRNGKAGRAKALVARMLYTLTTRNSQIARVWFTAPARTWLRAYPYFWFHYLFAEVVASSAATRAVWARTPRRSADDPLFLHHEGLFAPLSAEVRTAIDRREPPLYKLTTKVYRSGWRESIADYAPGCALDYALSAAGVDAEL